MYAFLADLHIGCKLPNEDILKSIDYYFELIKKENEECHQIFVCGDFFDHRLTVNELSFAAQVMVKIVCNKCRSDGNNVPVTFIHGTYSHDQEQYMIFIPIIERMTGVRIRYIDKAATFKINSTIKVLALPQEYGDIDYEEIFRNKYDIIIGHGPMSSYNDEPCPVGMSEICMPADLLGDISNVCVFGHYHEYFNFGKNVFYAGSMMRWKYGEDVEKCFLICKDSWEVKTYKNPFVMDFVKCDVYSPEELRQQISKEITNPHRFIIHCKENELEEYHSILNIYKKNKMISCKFISEKDKDTDRLPTDFIPIANVEPIPALISYIKEKYNKDAESIVKSYEEKINKEENKNEANK